MSGTLPKSPSEGDITAKIAEESISSLSEKGRLSQNSSFLTLASNKFYTPPDLKKGAFASSNFRIVWKSATYGDLSNLNKVLDLRQTPKRSSSPISPKVGPSDHVFSEYFDPLAVHKRENVELSGEEDSDSKYSPSTFHRITDRKRKDSEIQEIDMPSVKTLKSLFEKQRQDEEEAKIPPRFVRTNKKANEILEKNSTTVTNELNDSSIVIEGKNNKDHEAKRNSKNLSLIIVNENENSDLIEGNNEKTAPIENNMIKFEKPKPKDEVDNTYSKAANIEVDHIPKVKDLLSIFKGMESNKKASPKKNEIPIEKPVVEDRRKVAEKTEKLPVRKEMVEIKNEEKPIKKDEIEIKVGEKPIKKEKVDIEVCSATTVTLKSENKDSGYRYSAEEAIDTSTTSVYDLRKKWETLVIRSPAKILKENKLESHTKLEKEKNKEINIATMPKLDTETKMAIEKKGKELSENVKDITMVKAKDAEKELDTIKGKSSVEKKTIKIEETHLAQKELRKTDSDSVSTSEKSRNIIIEERKDEFRTSVKNLASLFEFKNKANKLRKTRSAPVTPAPTTSKVSFDYDTRTASAKSDKSYEIFFSPSVKEENKNYKSDIQNDHQESKIRETLKEVVSNSSTTLKSSSKDKKSPSTFQSLQKQYGSDSQLPTNISKTQTNQIGNKPLTTSTTSKTSTTIASTSDSVALEKTKQFKSGSQISNKPTTVQDVLTLIDADQKDSAKDSVQTSNVTNKRDEKQKIAENHSITVQNTEEVEKSSKEHKSAFVAEMSLGSLERKGSVTKMKSVYERQSSFETPKTEAPAKKIQHSHSVGSLKANNINNSQDTKNKSLSTIVQENNEINDRDDKKIELNIKEVDMNSEFSNRIKKEKKKSKIEELVESFVKSEGLNKYLETPTEENLSSVRNQEPEDPNLSKITKTSETIKHQQEKEKQKTPLLENGKKVSKSTTSLSSPRVEKPEENNKEKTLVARHGSRELRPDELKYFANMSSFNKSNNKKQQMRERSNSIDSSSPTSTLPKNEFSRSKMRSSSRQFRDLHSDEMKYFGAKINDRHSKKLLNSASEANLRHEVLERALLASTLGENEREE